MKSTTDMPVKMAPISKILAYKLLTFIDGFLQRIFAPARYRVAYASIPEYSDNAYFQFRYLVQAYDNLEHVWLVDGSHKLRERISSDFDQFQKSSPFDNQRLRIVERKSIKGYFAYLTSAVTFHTHGVYAFSRWHQKRQSVCLWHGMPIKCIGKLNRITPNPFPTHGTAHIASSSFFKYVIATAFQVPDTQVLESGLPRCDVFRYPEMRLFSTDEVRALLEIPSSQPLVLWMPTYRTEQVTYKGGAFRSFLDDMGSLSLEHFDSLAEKYGTALVIKLHPHDLLNITGLPKQYKHIRLVTAPEWAKTTVPLYECLAAADALISDVSSVLIDFLLTERPIGIVGYDAQNYTRDVVFSPDLLFSSVLVHHCESVSQLEAFFRSVGSGSKVISDEDISRVFNTQAQVPAARQIAEKVLDVV